MTGITIDQSTGLVAILEKINALVDLDWTDRMRVYRRRLKLVQRLTVGFDILVVIALLAILLPAVDKIVKQQPLTSEAAVFFILSAAVSILGVYGSVLGTGYKREWSEAVRAGEGKSGIAPLAPTIVILVSFLDCGWQGKYLLAVKRRGEKWRCRSALEYSDIAETLQCFLNIKSSYRSGERTSRVVGVCWTFSNDPTTWNLCRATVEKEVSCFLSEPIDGMQDMECELPLREILGVF